MTDLNPGWLLNVDAADNPRIVRREAFGEELMFQTDWDEVAALGQMLMEAASHRGLCHHCGEPWTDHSGVEEPICPDPHEMIERLDVWRCRRCGCMGTGNGERHIDLHFLAGAR